MTQEQEKCAVCECDPCMCKAVSDLKFVPTASMAIEAKRGLEWRREFNRGGTLVGVARANQIVNKENLSASTVTRMFSFFSRHEVDKQGQGFSQGEEGYPSAGRIAWALWGGDAGFSWSKKMRNRIEREEDKSLECQEEKHIHRITETEDTYIIEFGKGGEDSPEDMQMDLDLEEISSYEYNFVLDSLGAEYDDSIEEEKAPRGGKVTASIRKGLENKTKEHNEKVGDVKSKRTTTKTLIAVFKRGVGAYYSNPGSVRPNVRSPEQWALGRVNSFLYVLRNGRFRSGKHDTDLLPKEHSMSSKKSIHEMNSKIFNITSTFKSYTTEEEDDDDSIKIRGYASTNDTDRAGDIVESSAWQKSGGLDNYKNNPILLFNHNYDKPIGKATSLAVTPRGLEIEGKISKSAGHIAEMVKEGILSAFSVGFRVKDADWIDETEGYRIKDAELFEVSVVSVPANQGAIFSVTKSFDSEKDYSDWKAQFVNDPRLFNGQLAKSSPTETANAVFKENVMSDQDFNIEEFAREVARKTAAEIQMQAASKAAAEKTAADEQQVQKATEQAELEQKKAEVTAVVQGVTTGAERLMTDLETRVSKGQEDLYAVVDELRAELAEKSTEINSIRESKRTFADRSSGQDWRKSLEGQVSDAYFLGRATGKGYDTKLASDVMEKVNAMSGVGVSSADFEQEVSTNVERDIQLALVLPNLFREIQMRSASQIIPIMPDAGYAEFVSAQTTAGTSPHGNLNETGDAYGSFNGMDMTEKSISTKKLISQSYLGNETEEDAIIPILPLIREAVVRAHTRSMENMVLLGSHADGSGAGSAAPAGVVKLAADGSDQTQSATAFAAESLTAAHLLAARKNMGKYGINPADVVYIVNIQEYHNLIADSAYADAQQVNDMATKLTGQVGMVYGSPVIVSPEFATPAVAKYYAVAVNARNYIIPRLRGVTIESDYEVANQRRVLVASQRVGFDQLIAGANSAWALKYKGS